VELYLHRRNPSESRFATLTGTQLTEAANAIIRRGRPLAASRPLPATRARMAFLAPALSLTDRLLEVSQDFHGRASLAAEGEQIDCQDAAGADEQ
jgi:hypothetical protein